VPAEAAVQRLATPVVTRIFRAETSAVRQARRYLNAVMSGSSRADDAVLCLGELAANAVLHSRSGRTRGFFTVQIARSAGCWRVSVGDEGGPWQPNPGSGAGFGRRGLAIVAALSSRWQVDGDGVSGRVVWFELAEDG
jgi:serine/threonine-protein kinase RsbW